MRLIACLSPNRYTIVLTFVVIEFKALACFDMTIVWPDIGLLVVWFLWHINLCRLFNAKSIFKQIISSISNNSVYHENNFIVKNISISSYSVYQTVLIQTIQFSISLVLFNP